MKLLDTDICVHLLNAHEPELLQRFKLHSPPDLALCSVVRAELLWGARNSARVTENLERVELFCSPMRSLPFDDACADHYGVIRADLAARGEPIGPNDVLIAAIAVAHRATLVTRNLREFQRVEGLAVEVW
jgi:tRNA(fMet)-specific endonuclease VapC